jgi:hypothetical protein
MVEQYENQEHRTNAQQIQENDQEDGQWLFRSHKLSFRLKDAASIPASRGRSIFLGIGFDDIFKCEKKQSSVEKATGNSQMLGKIVKMYKRQSRIRKTSNAAVQI